MGKSRRKIKKQTMQRVVEIAEEAIDHDVHWNLFKVSIEEELKLGEDLMGIEEEIPPPPPMPQMKLLYEADDGSDPKKTCQLCGSSLQTKKMNLWDMIVGLMTLGLVTPGRTDNCINRHCEDSKGKKKNG